MANVQISDLPFATLPLVGATTFFEVEATEGGVVVSRRVAADDLVISATTLFIDGTSTDDPAIAAGVFDGQLLWRNANAQQTGVFGFDPAGDNFIWSNDAEGGFHQIAIRDGTVLVETVAAASGGLLINNLSTGAGLERVLTTADAFAGPVGTSVDDPTAPGSFNAQLQWQNALADPLANLGFNADAVFAIDSVVHGGGVRIRGEDLAGVLNTLFIGDPGNGVTLFWDGSIRYNTTFTGINVQGDGVGNPALGAAQDVDLTLSNSLGAFAAQLGFPTSTTDLRLKNFVHGGTVELIGEDAGGVERNIFVADPDGIAQIFNVGVATLRTTTAAAGGAEANNTLTGAGFERVLTASDAFTGIIEGSSTDSPETPGGTWDGVLRFDNANSLQTARVGFDPAGDTFFVQPTVEGGRLVLGGRSPGAPGPERESLIFDFDTGGLPAGSTRFFETNGTAEQMRLDTGVSAVTEVANVLNNPASGLAQHGQFRITNSLAQQAGEFGFPASGGLSTTMRMKNFVHGGPVELVGENAAGTERTLFFYDPDNSGPIIFGPLDNPPTTDASIQDTRLTFRNPSAQTIWQIGFLEGTNDFSLKLFQDTGTLRLRGSSAASADVVLAIFDPIADAKLFQAGAEVFRTVAAASGGAQANNTLTGAGFERVLTTADIFGGALNDLSDVTLTAPATGAVLYKSAGNWLDTPAITIDPAAAVQVFHAGVGTPKFRTTANGFDMLGDTATNSDFDLYSLDGLTLRAGIRTDGAGLRLESQVNSLSVTIFARSGAGALNAGLQVTGSTGITQLYFSAAIKLLTQSQGVTIRGNAANNVQLLLEGSSGIDHFQINAVGSNVTLNSTIDGSSVRFTGEDLGSVNRLMLDMDPDGEVNLYRIGVVRAGTRFDGFRILGLLTNNPATGGTQDVSLNIENQSAQLAGAIRYNTSTDMRIENLVHGGSILAFAEDAGGVLRSLIDLDPDGDSAIFHLGVEVARTLTAAAGGWQANNTLTGAGFERVLTIADRTSAAAYTPTNVVTTRTYDANATSIDELADVLGTLIADLQAINVIQ